MRAVKKQSAWGKGMARAHTGPLKKSPQRDLPPSHSSRLLSCAETRSMAVACAGMTSLPAPASVEDMAGDTAFLPAPASVALHAVHSGSLP